MISPCLNTLLSSYNANILGPNQDDYEIGAYFYELGHVDKWRTQSRMDVMSMNPR